MSESKPILCLDFDGVLRSDKSEWVDEKTIPDDPPVDGAVAFLRQAVKVFRVMIHSSESEHPDGIAAMCRWLGYWVREHRLSDDEDFAWASEIEWPKRKPSLFLTIDDRAKFGGKWPDLQVLLAFWEQNKTLKLEPNR